MITRRMLGVAASCFLMLALTGVNSLAQFNSAIEGIVSDASGGVIPDARVVLTNVDTRVAYTTRTNSAGYYRFPALPPGNYKVTASREGFQTVTQENVTLEAVRVQDVALTMTVGTVKTEVTVTAAPPAVETTEAKISSLVSGVAVHDLPLVGRNVLDVVAQTPGVTGPGTVGDVAGANDIFNLVSGVAVSANGQRFSSNGFYVDDSSVNDNPDGGGAKITPSIDSIQELRVSVNNYSAQYGRNSSILVQMVTKSGTNDIHGSMFWFHQDNAITARNFLQNTVNPLTNHILPTSRRNEFGGSLGLPLRKDKTFVFASWDQLRQSVANSGLIRVETPEFANFMKTIFPSRVSTYLLNNFPAAVSGLRPGTIKTVADLAGACLGTGPLGMPCNLPLTGQAVFSFSTPRNGLQWNVRMDQIFANSKDRLYGNWIRMTVQPTNTQARPAFGYIRPGYTDYAGLNWTHTFSPTVVNEAAIGFTRNLGYEPCANCRVPGMFIVGLQGFGDFWGPGLFVQNDFHWRDLVAFNRGKHALKAGLDIYRDQDNAPFSGPVLRPFFGFLSVFDFANDAAFGEFNINYDPRTGAKPYQDYEFRSTTYGFFVQDDWKAKSNLALNVGLRWDFSSNPTEATGHLTNLKLGDGSTFQERIAGASVVPVKAMFSNHRIGYFAPRLGFAWDPTRKGRMSIRGGYGVFFDRWPNKVWSDTTRGNPPYLAAIEATIFDPSGPQPLFTLCGSDKLPFDCPLPTLVVGLNPRNGPIAGRASVGGTDPGLKYAYAQNWFVGIQYAFLQNWVVESNYMGSMGHHLYTVIDRNRFAGDTLDGSLSRLNPFFNSINYGDNNGNSAYNGGTISLRKRFNRGYSFQTAYTFGKAIDYTNSRSGGSSSVYAPVFDAYNFKRQRGLSELDVSKKLAFNFIWELPKPNVQNRVLHGFLAGWETSSLAVIESGQPFTVFTDGEDYNADGNFYDVPNTPTFGNSKNGLSRSDYMRGVFSASDFPVPPLGVEGNLGRNTFRGPGLAQVDFGIIKNTHMPWFVKEGANFQLRAEFYNFFNRVNLSGWDTDLASGTFGLATGAYTPRALQVGLRIEF